MKLRLSPAILKLFSRSYLLPLAMGVFAALLVFNELGFRHSTAAAMEITEAQEKRATINVLLQQMLDAETGQRGYLLTGQKKYLRPYNEAIAAVAQTLDKLRTLYVDEPNALATFARLSRAISRKMGEMDVTVKLRDVSSDADRWLAVLETGVGTEQMDTVRTLAGTLGTGASSEMTENLAKIHRSLELSRIGITLAALLGVGAFFRYLQQARELQRLALREKTALAVEAKRLEQLVAERTNALADLATYLQDVQEKERERLARELHDELGALLTSAKLDVARTKATLPPDNEKSLARLAHLNETINEVVKLKRRIIEDLRPSSLANLGLQAALEVLARDYRERSGLTVTLDVEDVKLSDESELTIFRLIQESLTNVTKYAHAKEVAICLHEYPGHVEVSVTDDGVGFNVHALSLGTHGLSGMRHRIRALEGQFSVNSSPQGGTRIEAVIPKIARAST